MMFTSVYRWAHSLNGQIVTILFSLHTFGSRRLYSPGISCCLLLVVVVVFLWSTLRTFFVPLWIFSFKDKHSVEYFRKHNFFSFESSRWIVVLFWQLPMATHLSSFRVEPVRSIRLLHSNDANPIRWLIRMMIVQSQTWVNFWRIWWIKLDYSLNSPVWFVFNPVATLRLRLGYIALCWDTLAQNILSLCVCARSLGYKRMTFMMATA